MGMLFYYLLFFFIKQKTAYEMRISDWSSDVCSSDLCGMQIDFLAPARLVDVLDVRVVVIRARLASMAFAQQVRCGERVLVEATVRAACLTASTFRSRPQLGRASCRARVCQYV